jgi:hypothetical protein
MTVFWAVAPWSLVEVYRRFRDVYYLNSLITEAVNISETSVNFY